MRRLICCIFLIFSSSSFASDGKDYTALKNYNNTDLYKNLAVDAAATSLDERGYIPEDFLVKVESNNDKILVWLVHKRILKVKELFPGNMADEQICTFEKANKTLIDCLYLQ